jgi:L-rhamnose isomerase
MMDSAIIEKTYHLAQERYSQFGVNSEKALEILEKVSLSLHCWQGDDLGGFEKPDSRLAGGGLQVTGNYPGRARTVDELRMDLKKAYSLIPGRHRLNLHAMYGDFSGKPVDRNEINLEHYKGWIDWAKQEDLKLDFNPTCFSHPTADSGLTLSSKDIAIREFWIEHVKRCREISASMGQELQSPCIHNLWIPDGTKDIPVDRWTHRTLLREALDTIYAVEYRSSEMKDSIESKLFGIGSESFVVGSHEFYIGYALSRGKMLCLDLGHFHPTESVADKISSILQFSEELLLHISRGVRWDSDHVVILNDEVKSLTEEIVRSSALDRVHIALDFFDASMNRIGAWVIGARATLKGLLYALLEPQQKLIEAEDSGNNFARLALMEELGTMPFGAVWDHYCLRMDVPVGELWMEEVKRYEEEVTKKR